jgi:antitoxin FitA
MPKMIQIRNVPDDLHRKLKARAAQAGMSLSDYLLNEIRKGAEMPTLDEWFAPVATHSPVTLSESPAEMIRRVRDQE